jgi:thiol-disulfide isomerase/thioredoxin
VLVVSLGSWVLVIAVLAALCFGGYRAVSDGRFRGTRRVPGAADTSRDVKRSLLAETPWSDQLGERATLLQFSSAFCAPCRATRRVLDQVAGTVPGVVHLEVDAEAHLDLVRRLGILRTPTTLVLDRTGHEVSRASGAPTKDQVLSSLASAVD